MSKKYGRGVLLLAGILSIGTLGALASCGENKKPDTDTEQHDEVKVTKLAITNRDALTAKWTVGEANREVKLDFECTPAKTLPIALQDGTITVTSSDATIVKTAKNKLQALKEGEVTITVKAGDKTDSVKIKVEARVITNVQKAFEDEVTAKTVEHDKGESKNVYTFQGRILATDKEKNVLFVDKGGKVTYAKDPAGAAAFNVGDTVYFASAKVSNYYGMLNVKGGTMEACAEKVDNEVTPIALTGKQLDAWQDKVLATSKNGIKEVKDIHYPEYIKLDTIYGGKTYKDPKDPTSQLFNCDFLLKGAKKGEKLNTAKSTPEFLKAADEFEVGATYTLTGGLLGWNSKFEYYNVIGVETKFVKEAPLPETMEIVTKDLKVNDVINFEDTLKYGPEGKEFIVEPTIEIVKDGTTATYFEAGKDIVITGKGTIKVNVKVAGKGGKTLTDTKVFNVVDGESTSAYAKTVTDKSLSDIIALGDTDTTKYYKTQVLVFDADTTSDKAKFGKVTIADPTTYETTKTYGFTKGLDTLRFKGEGVDKPSSSVDFTTVVGTDFKVGDKIEVLIYASFYNGALSCNAVYLSTVEEGAVDKITWTVTLPKGVTADKTENIKPDDKIKLTYAGDEKLLFNGLPIEKGTDGKYEITVNKGPNVVSFEALPEGAAKFTWVKPATLDENENTYTSGDLVIIHKRNSGSAIKPYDQLRFYANQSLTFKSATGKDIEYITMTDVNDKTYTAEHFVVTGGTLTIEGRKLTLKPTAGSKEITITCKDGKEGGQQTRFTSIYAQFVVEAAK